MEKNKAEILSALREYLKADPDGLIAVRIQAMIDRTFEERI